MLIFTEYYLSFLLTKFGKIIYYRQKVVFIYSSSSYRGID